jgi:hypothetical protein
MQLQWGSLHGWSREVSDRASRMNSAPRSTPSSLPRPKAKKNKNKYDQMSNASHLGSDYGAVEFAAVGTHDLLKYLDHSRQFLHLSVFCHHNCNQTKLKVPVYFE